MRGRWIREIAVAVVCLLLLQPASAYGGEGRGLGEETAAGTGKLVGVEQSAEDPVRFSIAESRAEGVQQLVMAAAQIRDSEERVVYVTGKNWEPDGIALKACFGDRVSYSRVVEEVTEDGADTYYVTRFRIVMGTPPPRGQEVRPGEREPWDLKKDRRQHWNRGDRAVGEIDGERYLFRCIDPDYSDPAGNHPGAALFLCDSVIPANVGSAYTYEKGAGGTYRYVFQPGPVVNFGDSNDYKYSKIRAWLSRWEENFPGALEMKTGLSHAYQGQTEAGSTSQLRPSDLRRVPIGDQQLTGKLFILSVDEALKYRNWLWSFGGEEENPRTQTGAFSRGYWLRSPAAGSGQAKGGQVYVVDLDGGNIRPEPVHPDGMSEDAELQVTGAMGVRPAFVLPQR